MMDDYEAFFDSYIEFMKSYDSSNPVLLMKYMEMMGKYTEAMEALEKIDESELTKEELQYYTDTMLRIEKKLLDASIQMG